VLYFATYHLNAGSGVMVTGSHNPPDYNGFKIVIGGETLADAAIQALYSRSAEGRFAEGRGGLKLQDVAGAYIDRISGDIQTDRPLRIVVDAGNGIAGAIGPQVLEAIGCEVQALHCEVDGNFPNHHPDPSDPKNLADLILTVQRTGADLGVAFDGDRLGVVTRSGEIIYPDRLLMLFATDVLTRNPGATVIYDVKCTGHLRDVVLRHGGSPLMWKTGHSLIKAKMREEGAELAGEMSGHFFFQERWFGFDDGIYSAARLAEILAADGRDPEEIFGELPKGVSTPELKVPMEEGAHHAFIERFRERAEFPGASISTIDGIRADYPDGWGLVRASNTTPVLVLRFDADSDEALLRIQQAFREQLLAVEPTLRLPF
jgi:phosphomannomutase/phosphoglucomutase